MARLGKGSPRIEGLPPPYKVSGHLHAFLLAKPPEYNDCHLFVSACLDTHVSILKWEELTLLLGALL